MPLYLTLIASGYLLGSISTAILVCRLLGLPDPRSQGSRNPGATNVLRIGGKSAAATTLLGDMLKGALPVLAATLLQAPAWAVAATGATALLGHMYPVFFQFKGGKGVATALGVIIGLDWVLALCAAATWLVMAKLFRISSLAALTAAALTPVYAWLLNLPTAYLAMLVPMCLLVLWRHKGNIQRLLSGEEGSFGR